MQHGTESISKAKTGPALKSEVKINGVSEDESSGAAILFMKSFRS